MTRPEPDFMRSKYFVAKPKWHLKPGASAKDKRELEEWMNEGNFEIIIENPEMKKPWYTWSGKVIDKG